MDEVQGALQRLGSESFNERLAAARELNRLGMPLSREDDRVVREALATEPVPWVRGALSAVLDQDGDGLLRQGVEIPAPVWDERFAGLDPEIGREATNLATGRVLHEVAAVVGRAELAASTALGEAYGGSATSKELRYLADTCGALRTLNSATKRPAPTEFDLKTLVTDVTRGISQELLFPVQADGLGPFIVIADQTLLSLALRNILLNAVEATVGTHFAGPQRPVTVTWGPVASGVAVSVIDRGPGPPSFLAALKTAGVSTKEGHPGYGLATASEALRSMNGTVTIRRNDRGGATVILAWSDT